MSTVSEVEVMLVVAVVPDMLDVDDTLLAAMAANS